MRLCLLYIENSEKYNSEKKINEQKSLKDTLACCNKAVFKKYPKEFRSELLLNITKVFIDPNIILLDVPAIMKGKI